MKGLLLIKYRSIGDKKPATRGWF